MDDRILVVRNGVLRLGLAQWNRSVRVALPLVL